jgi:hypothetical protein
VTDIRRRNALRADNGLNLTKRRCLASSWTQEAGVCQEGSMGSHKSHTVGAARARGVDKVIQKEKDGHRDTRPSLRSTILGAAGGGEEDEDEEASREREGQSVTLEKRSFKEDMTQFWPGLKTVCWDWPQVPILQK